MTADLSSIWCELEATAAGRGILGRRFLPGAPIDLFVGIDKPENVRLAFIEARQASLCAWPRPWPESSGFSVDVEELPGNTSRVRIIVRLARSAYAGVFGSLVEDVLTAIGKATSEEQAVQLLGSRLEMWQSFMARHGAEGLSLPEQVGLFGELWCLSTIVLPECDPASAVAAWTGPLAGNQDFQLPGCSIEVKTTSGNPDHRIEISNIRQLDDQGALAPLLLLHVGLEKRHAQGLTLVELVKQVRQQLSPVAEMFEERLVQAGYLDAHAGQYMATWFDVKVQHFFRVRDGFPRITEAELRPGVGAVRYQVALGACAPFAIDRSVVSGLIRGGA